mgnify:CR=1 FL=1
MIGPVLDLHPGFYQISFLVMKILELVRFYDERQENSPSTLTKKAKGSEINTFGVYVYRLKS